MPINKDNYVIINVWTSKGNKAIPGANVGHVSLTTPNRYISLWPNNGDSYKKFAGVSVRPPAFQRDYEQDCMDEMWSENGDYEICLMPELADVKDYDYSATKKVIEPHKLYVALLADGSLQYVVSAPSRKIINGNIDLATLRRMRLGLPDLKAPLTAEKLLQLEPFLFDILEITAARHHTKEVLNRRVHHGSVLREGETLYRFENNGGYMIWRDAIPADVEDKYSFLAIRLVQANFRIALYSLNVTAIEDTFDRLKPQIPGWSMAGSNLLSQTFWQKGTVENCASLALRCLDGGGFSGELRSKLSSKTSSAVSPDDLLRRVVALKERELNDHPATAAWIIENVNESPFQNVKDAYSRIGLSANAEEDIFPGVVPSSPSCIML